MLKTKTISVITFTIIALLALALKPLRAQETPGTITSFGVHSLAAGSFKNAFVGVNGSVLTPVQENSFVEFAALLQYKSGFVSGYSGLGFQHIFKTEFTATYYAKISSGISILTATSDIGQSPTDSFFDELSQFGIGAQAGFGMRNEMLDAGLIGMYQNLPGAKFWIGLQTGFWF